MINAVNAPTLAPAATAERVQRTEPDPRFKQLDTGNKGYLTAEDLQATVVQISPEAARQATSDNASVNAKPAPRPTNAAPAPSAQELLSRMDGDADGKVTEQEFKAAAPEAPPSAGARGGAAEAPPAAGAGGAAGSSAASSTQAYQPADTNEDGQVSTLEQQAYEVKLAAEKATEQAAQAAQAAQSTASTSRSDVSAAVKAYAAIEQLGPAGA